MKLLARICAFAFAVLSCALSLNAQTKKKVIIDQDAAGPGGTDMQAILALVNSPETEVLGITVLTGDAWRDEEVQHTLRLMEIMAGQTLMSDASAQSVHPNPPASAPDHSKMLNAAEKRLLAEWIDTGGKYYNDPFDPTSGTVLLVNTLDENAFIASVYPILQNTCAGCHQARGSTNTTTTATSFTDNRYVLTGDPDGDWGVTMTMVNDVCHPPTSYLLERPSTIPHPDAATTQTTAVLPANSANYATIANWIAAGCLTP